MYKMLTSSSMIIESWNEACLNQESRGQVHLKKSCLVIYFCKIHSLYIEIRIFDSGNGSHNV